MEKNKIKLSRLDYENLKYQANIAYQEGRTINAGNPDVLVAWSWMQACCVILRKHGLVFEIDDTKEEI